MREIKGRKIMDVSEIIILAVSTIFSDIFKNFKIISWKN